jgi:hypothetical protein
MTVAVFLFSMPPEVYHAQREARANDSNHQSLAAAVLGRRVALGSLLGCAVEAEVTKPVIVFTGLITTPLSGVHNNIARIKVAAEKADKIARTYTAGHRPWALHITSVTGPFLRLLQSTTGTLATEDSHSLDLLSCYPPTP